MTSLRSSPSDRADAPRFPTDEWDGYSNVATRLADALTDHARSQFVKLLRGDAEEILRKLGGDPRARPDPWKGRRTLHFYEQMGEGSEQFAGSKDWHLKNGMPPYQIHWSGRDWQRRSKRHPSEEPPFHDYDYIPVRSR